MLRLHGHGVKHQSEEYRPNSMGRSVATTRLDSAVTDLGRLLPNWEVGLALSQVIGANGDLEWSDGDLSHDSNTNLVIQELANLIYATIEEKRCHK